MHNERRTILRVPFVAYAEITETGTDVSRDGCYVDLRSALAEGTSVQVKIKTATELFEASAVVGYHTFILGWVSCSAKLIPSPRRYFKSGSLLWDSNDALKAWRRLLDASAHRLRVNQMISNCVSHQFDHRRQVQFQHDTTSVGFHSADANLQGFADGLI
jgi:hypothetical protein